MNRVVNLTKTHQDCPRSPLLRFVYADNKRAKRDVLVVNGAEEKHPEGGYFSTGRKARNACTAAGPPMQFLSLLTFVAPWSRVPTFQSRYFVLAAVVSPFRQGFSSPC